MKKLFALALAGASLLTANAIDFESAADAVRHMGPGINLSNSLECHSRFTDLMMIEQCTRVATSYKRPGGWNSGNMPYITHFANYNTNGYVPTIADYETAWEQPQTTRALIKLWKAAGFNAVRVPVTWYPHMDVQDYLASITPNASEASKYDEVHNTPGYGNYKDGYTPWCAYGFKTFYGIQGNGGTWDVEKWLRDTEGKNVVDPAWMNRVQEVVDMIIEEGMYCIINVHHDTGSSSHEAPELTSGPNSRWLNANFDWWPAPAQSSAPLKEMGDGSTNHGDVYKIVTTAEGTTDGDPMLVLTFNYSNWQWTTWSFEIFALEDWTLHVDMVDSNGNSIYSNNNLVSPDNVIAKGGQWKKYKYSMNWANDGTYQMRVYLNTTNDGQRKANTYYIDNISMEINGTSQTPPTPTLTGEGGTMSVVDFTNEGVSTGGGNTGGGNTGGDTPTDGVQHLVKAKFIDLWEQIATRFADYGDHLLFEGYNEMLDNSEWGGSDVGKQVVADMAKTFISVVRNGKDGNGPKGFNGQRNIIINPYAAKRHKIDGITDDGHMIVELHNYGQVGTNEYEWGADDLNGIIGALSGIKTDMGNMPAILGEWGTTDIFLKDVFYPENVSAVATFAESLEQQTKNMSSAAFIWRSLCDEGYRGYYDSNNNFVAPQWNPAYSSIKDAIIRGWYGSADYAATDYGVYPNLYNVYNGAASDYNNNYLGTNRAVTIDGTPKAKNLTITDANPYRLKDSENNTLSGIYTDKLTYTRDYTHSDWTPLYVPFSVNPSDYSGMEFATFKDIVLLPEGSTGTIVKLIIQKTTNEIPANTPCLVKATAGTHDMVKQYVTLLPPPATNTTISGGDGGYLNFELCGTYEPVMTSDLDEPFSTSTVYAMSEGKFRAMTADETLNPNRLYLRFWYKDGVAPQQIRIVVDSDDPELSSIADLVSTPHDNVYYDLMGRPVAHPTAGIYVRNGQKVYIR